jgi:hypothetical protein
MAEIHHKKQQITAALTAPRVQVQNEAALLKRKLDMKQHFLESIKKHPWEWASCAAAVGWLLSRIPTREKKINIDHCSQKPVKRPNKGPLGKLWREVWQFSKPTLAAYLAKLLAEHAKSSENKGLRTDWLKTESPKDVSEGINGRRS